MKEALEVRQGRPIVSTNCATGHGVEQVVARLMHDVLFSDRR
jgi:Ni2+-binding GTPase involved in maturation of urease and hydrogenase